MTKYSTELSKTKESLRKTAQFYKVAFHCHSPLSHDWRKNKGDFHKVGRLVKFQIKEVDQWVKDGKAAPKGGD